MSRAKSWYTARIGAGTVPDAAYEGALTMATDLVDPTVLRTRAGVTVAYGSSSVPPFYTGNGFTANVLRVVASGAGGLPDPGWQFSPDAVDDVIFHPVEWGPGLYVPPNTDFGRPEALWFTGELAGGVADSAGQRHIDGTDDVVASWYVGPVLGLASAYHADFTVSLWIRMLVEATI